MGDEQWWKKGHLKYNLSQLSLVIYQNKNLSFVIIVFLSPITP